jgi:lipopolysaccharide biosynthesis regulator YciM
MNNDQLCMTERHPQGAVDFSQHLQGHKNVELHARSLIRYRCTAGCHWTTAAFYLECSCRKAQGLSL